MKKSNRAFLQDMLDHAQMIQRAIVGKTQADLEADFILKAAVHYWVQTIGEAANHISSDFQEAHPALEWKAMIGLRNRLVHAYTSIDPDILWDVVAQKIPPLIVYLTALLEDISD